MKKLTPVILAVGAAALLIGSAPGTSYAQSKSMRSSNPNATQIMGNTKIKVQAQSVRTTAAGRNAKASTNIGAIGTGTQIMGNTKIIVKAKDVTTQSYGSGTEATTNIGTIGNTK